MTAPNGIRKLVERFDRNSASYLSSQYNETQLRREFVDPVFELLGWDVSNTKGSPETYKDVVHEDSIRIGSKRKAPDYAFRIGGERRFFVETKAPHKNLDVDASASYQLRRYGWSAKLPLSILTDFEEFSVYDTRVRPNKGDSARTARILYFNHTEYLDRWEEIEALFSKNAVASGALTAYAIDGASNRETLAVDKSFLQEIESWREKLARNIALRNSNVGLRGLNAAVQLIIDRIIFLRICEDRGIELYEKLKTTLAGQSVYGQLVKLFYQADEKYNSGLFHFQDEVGRLESPDVVTPKLNVDNKVVTDIISSLYYPDSPFEFSVFPPDILGQVYEQFLGKVIRFTPSKRVKIELKPEVRKSGGVYYTPTFIIDFIVRKTLGTLLAETDSPRKVAQISVLDPACGSGSFLLGAYQTLLDWHLTHYQADGVEKHSKGRKPKIYQTEGNEWRLTVSERKRILLNSIYGVDIDPQAVEVTKLSLLLKVLEGSNSENLEQEYRFFQERALPDLINNIKCGNSLIETDYYRSKELFEDDTEFSINAFDYGKEFKDIFDLGGVDVVIGNPPYLSYSGRQAVKLDPCVREYYDTRYESAGWLSSHGLFILKSLNISKRMIGFIVPDQIGHLKGYENIRNAVTRQTSIMNVCYWGENVFSGVVTPALTFITDVKHNGATEIQLKDQNTAEHSLSGGNAWQPRSRHTELIEKLNRQATPLPECFADPGVHTGNCATKLIFSEEESPKDSMPVLEGKQVSRYACNRPNKVLRLKYEPQSGDYFRIGPKEKYKESKFVIRQTASFPIVGPRKHAIYFRNSLLALYPPLDGRHIHFVVGLLNSRLMRYVYQVSVSESSQKAFPQVKVGSLRVLPLRRIEFTDQKERASHDEIVDMVTTMVHLHEKKEEVETAHHRRVLNRRIDALDRDLDQVVERLYGLNPIETDQVESFLANASAKKEVP